MKKLLVTFLLALAAGTTIAATVTHLVSREGGPPIGQRSVTFELDGVDYVITDKATLDQIDKVTHVHLQAAEAAGKFAAEQAMLRARRMKAKTAAEREALAKEEAELTRKQNALAGQLDDAEDRIEEELEKIFRNAVRTGVARRR